MWLADYNIANSYERVVSECLHNEDTFKNFKQNSSYTSVVGMSNDTQGQVWFSHLSNYTKISKQFEKFKLNDTIGNPLFGSNEMTPNTLRYINTLSEIDSFFKIDKRKKLKVAELGVGGLCFILSNYYNIESYCLIDLPVVQEFSKKYLKKLGVDNTTTDYENPDIFISEFCLSEFDDTQMYDFYNRYVVNSKMIYLHMNLHDLVRKEKFLEVLSKDFDYEISDEFPKTEWDNYVIRGIKKK